MIFLWIGQFFAWLHWLFVPPINALPRQIDQNAPCIICGHRQGKLSAATNGTAQACLHTCSVCGGKWFEPTVLSDVLPPTVANTAAVIAPSVTAATAKG